MKSSLPVSSSVIGHGGTERTRGSRAIFFVLQLLAFPAAGWVDYAQEHPVSAFAINATASEVPSDATFSGIQGSSSCPHDQLHCFLLHHALPQSVAAAGTSTVPATHLLRRSAAQPPLIRHGGTERMRGSRAIFFVLQVSYQSKLPYYCFKSDDAFIVVLPCPGALFQHLGSLLLLLCGDVECNPGPNESSAALAEVLKTVKDLNERSIRIETVQNAVAETVTELKDQQINVFQAISDIKARLEVVEGQTAILQQWQTDVRELRDS